MATPESSGLTAYQQYHGLRMAQETVPETAGSALSAARQLLLYASVPSSGRRTWLAGDTASLNSMFWMEYALPEAIESPYLTPSYRAPLKELADTYHGALPYVEPERSWLVRSRDESWERQRNDPDRRPGPMETVPGIKLAEGEIVSAGRVVRVTGRDLLRRWWSWRRGVDEFEGEGTLNLARETLVKIGELLVTPEARRFVHIVPGDPESRYRYGQRRHYSYSSDQLIVE